jgi:hypothetical protein
VSRSVQIWVMSNLWWEPGGLLVLAPLVMEKWQVGLGGIGGGGEVVNGGDGDGIGKSLG